jgi:hypothetical protein
MAAHTIRSLGGPGTAWTRGVSDRDFVIGDEGVRRRAVVHRDPWVLFNVRGLREVLYPGGVIADLLEATPNVGPADSRTLYEEAVGTLRAQVEELEGRPYPALRNDLQKVRRQLAGVERRLRNPATPLPTEPFSFDTLAGSSVSPNQAARLAEVASLVARPCETCHRVEHATIARVSGDQRTLVRATFDHRKHLVQSRCLDCHRQIPIRALADTSKAAPPDRDMAAILNLPSIETCVDCHTKGKASTACATCHDFHPKRTRPSELPLALE